MTSNAGVFITADNDHVPSGEAQFSWHSFADSASQYCSFSHSEALYSETLRSIHGPPKQGGQALIVSCAYAGPWITSRELESSNSGDQGQPDQRTRISPNCVQRNAGREAGKIGR